MDGCRSNLQAIALTNKENWVFSLQYVVTVEKQTILLHMHYLKVSFLGNVVKLSNNSIVLM